MNGIKEIFEQVAVQLFPNGFVRIFMNPTPTVLAAAPGIIRTYGLSFLLLPVLAGPDAIWLAMPLTELVTAVFVIFSMIRCTRQLPGLNPGL